MELMHLQEEALQDLAFLPEAEWSAADQAHLQACDTCREALEAYQLIYAGLSDQADPEFSASFEADIIARLPELAPSAEPVPVAEPLLPQPAAKRRELLWWGGIAAAVAVPIAVLSIFSTSTGRAAGADAVSNEFGKLGETFSSLLQGNELLVGTGIACFAGLFLLDRFLSRRRNESVIPE